MPTKPGNAPGHPAIRALNLYYASTPQLRDEVLATRLRASAVRVAIGLPHGRIFLCTQSHAQLPDVMWDCPFADAAAHERDMDARAASAEFEAVRAQMRPMLRRFGRVLYEVVMAAEVDLPDADRGRIAQLWLTRSGAIQPARSDVLAALGRSHRQDATLLRRHDNEADLPDWIVEVPVPGNDNADSNLAVNFAAIGGTSVLASTWERRA